MNCRGTYCLDRPCHAFPTRNSIATTTNPSSKDKLINWCDRPMFRKRHQKRNPDIIRTHPMEPVPNAIAQLIHRLANDLPPLDWKT